MFWTLFNFYDWRMFKERKNYLIEGLSKDETAYLKSIIVNTRKRYIKDNYSYINNQCVSMEEVEEIEGESVLDLIINKCEDEIKSAVEFEKVISDSKLYYAIKALSLREKMVLFSLYKENKSINMIAMEMNLERTTIWRIKAIALDKIMKYLIGGKRDV